MTVLSASQIDTDGSTTARRGALGPDRAGAGTGSPLPTEPTPPGPVPFAPDAPAPGPEPPVTAATPRRAAPPPATRRRAGPRRRDHVSRTSDDTTPEPTPHGCRGVAGSGALGACSSGDGARARRRRATGRGARAARRRGVPRGRGRRTTRAAPTTIAPSRPGPPYRHGSSHRCARAEGPMADAVTVETIADGLAVPWGVAFLPDGDALVTSGRPAGSSAVDAGGARHRGADPRESIAAGEGGLLGLAVSPTYAAGRPGLRLLHHGRRTTGSCGSASGGAPQPDPDRHPAGRNHNGGRIAFGPDGFLYAGTGDAGETGQRPGPRLARRQDPAHDARRRPRPGNPIAGSPV